VAVISAADMVYLEEQLGRPPYPPLRVVCRCAAGRPMVVEQPASTPDGTPFPTAYWLCCPGLIRAVSELESAGGVHALELRLDEDVRLADSFDEAAARHRALRPEFNLGIGGVRAPRRAKCLHAHVAFALAEPPYLVGEEILHEAGGLPTTCCMGDTA